MSDSLTT